MGLLNKIFGKKENNLHDRPNVPYKIVKTIQGDIDTVRQSLPEIIRDTVDFKIEAVSFSPEGKYLAAGGGDNIIRIFEMPSVKRKTSLQKHTNSVSSLAFTLDGQYLASGSWDKTVRIWGVPSWKEIAVLKHEEDIYSLSFSPNGKYLAVGVWDCVKIWDVSSMHPIVKFEEPRMSVSFSQDGRYLLCESSDLFVIRDVSSWKEISSKYLRIGARAVFSRDRHYLATGLLDYTVHVWDTSSPDISSWREVAILQGHTEGTDAFAFSPDTRYLASGSWDRTIRLWDVSSWQEKLTLQHTNEILSVSFSSDGRYLAAGGNGLSLRVWELYVS